MFFDGGRGSHTTMVGGAGKDHFRVSYGTTVIKDYTSGEDGLYDAGFGFAGMEVVNDGKDIVFYSSDDDAISVTLENAVGKALTFDNNDRRSSVTFDFSTDTIVAEKSYSGFMYENSSDESILHSSWVGHDFVTVDGRNLKNGITIQGNLLDNVIYGSTKSDTMYGEASTR